MYAVPLFATLVLTTFSNLESTVLKRHHEIVTNHRIATTLDNLESRVLKSHHGLITDCTKKHSGNPCACKTVVTNMDVKQGTKFTTLEFLEVVCLDKENTKRQDDGRILGGFTCRNVAAVQTLYRNSNDQPVKPVPIKYTAGCELRCTTKRCAKVGEEMRDGLPKMVIEMIE